MNVRAGNEIVLYGTVGASFWEEEHFTAAQVREQLQGRTGALTVRINSGGGVATEGQAIHAMLREYPGHVTVIIEGVAASAASLIAMAGDVIVMTQGAYLLIHDPATPYTLGRGTSEEHARLAAQLDAISNGYAAIYAARTGLSVEDVRAMMRDEALMVDDEAVAKGFADRVDRRTPARQAAAFDYRIYSKAPPAAASDVKWLARPCDRAAALAMIAGHGGGAAKAKEATMNDQITSPPAPAAPVPPASDASARAERDRASKILASATMAGRPELAAKLIADGVPFDEANRQIVAAWAGAVDDMPRPGAPTARILQDHTSPIELAKKQADGLAARLAKRLGMKYEPTIGREYAEDTLVDMKTRQIEALGYRVGKNDNPFTMASHTTDDFPLAVGGGLTSIVGRMMESAPVAIAKLAREIPAADYRDGFNVDLTGSGVPEKINENGEVKFTSINETGEAKATPDDYGSIFRITRQALYNDSTAMGLLADAGRLMVKGAMQLQRQVLIAPLVANSGLGQTMRDGQTLFHSSHGNLAASGAVLSVTALSAARTAMFRQKDSKGNQLAIEPKYLLVPPERQTEAEQLVATIQALEASKVNPFADMLEVVTEPGLSNVNAWYLVADPQMVDGLAFAYLDGMRSPEVLSREGWEKLGMEFRLVWSIGAAFHGFQGWYRNPGA